MMPRTRNQAKRVHRMLATIAAVMLLGAAGCVKSIQPPSATLNVSASLTGSLPANPLQWRVITSMADSSASTMSTLYGNDPAIAYARSNSAHDYPAGSVLALVNWTERDDPRWFGAKIPHAVLSVEFVSVAQGPDGKPAYSYEKYEGSPLQKSQPDPVSSTARITYLLSQRSAVFP